MCFPMCVCVSHSDKAGVEQELRAVRQELSDTQRLNNLLREEMELIKEEHVAITMQVGWVTHTHAPTHNTHTRSYHPPV